MNVRFSIIAYHIGISVSYFDQQKMYVHIKWHLLTAIHNKCELVLCYIFISVALYFVLCTLLRKPELLRHWNPFETVQMRTRTSCLSKGDVWIKSEANAYWMFRNLHQRTGQPCGIFTPFLCPLRLMKVPRINRQYLQTEQMQHDKVNLANNRKLLSEDLYDLYII